MVGSRSVNRCSVNLKLTINLMMVYFITLIKIRERVLLAGYFIRPVGN